MVPLNITKRNNILHPLQIVQRNKLVMRTNMKNQKCAILQKQKLRQDVCYWTSIKSLDEFINTKKRIVLF